jgi:hypothetical protein
MDDDALRKAIAEAAEDATGQAARERVCDVLGAAFSYVGMALWTGGYVVGPDRPDGTSPFGFGSDATVGLAIVLQIAGELTLGSTALLAGDNIYAAAALVRQMVEVEYLAWAFAEDDEEAEAWMRSSRSERMKLWQPRHIRKRSAGRFRATDYAGHCERGGHPTPKAVSLLKYHGGRPPVAMEWLDLAEHVTSTWRYARAAIDKVGWSKALAQVHQLAEAEKAVGAWQEADSLRQLLREHREHWSQPS